MYIYASTFSPKEQAVVKSVAIVGASGYSGAELMRILIGRDDVTVASVMAAKSAGERVDALYPDLAGRTDLVFEAVEPLRLVEADCVFLALPSGEAMSLVPRIVSAAAKVIDLSGDFRLPDPGLYRQFYGREHTAPELLGTAVYGLPELYGDAIARAHFVANPGCYPTGAILALLPALRAGLIDPASIVVNALSGVSGAGRSASVELSFSELNENARAYKVGTHQHIPEIQTVLEKATGSTVRLTFVPHLIPVTRGIYTSVCADLAREVTTDEARELYRQFYAHSPFVRVKRGVPELKAVVRTNYCDIAVIVESRTGRLIIQSVIDNMVKGAAGQAVQNMNLMFGMPEELSLL